LPDALKIETTSGMRKEAGKGLKRLTVTRLTSLIFVILGAVDVIGIIYCLKR
jgi:hypothetical protein